MLVAIVAFFILAGIASLLVARRLVDFREASPALADVDIETLGLEELRMLIIDILAEKRDLHEKYIELQRDGQEIREMVLAVRLVLRRDVQRTAKLVAESQRGMTDIEARLRQVESDSGPVRVPTRGEWVPSNMPATASA